VLDIIYNIENTNTRKALKLKKCSIRKGPLAKLRGQGMTRDLKMLLFLRSSLVDQTADEKGRPKNHKSGNLKSNGARGGPPGGRADVKTRKKSPEPSP